LEDWTTEPDGSLRLRPEHASELAVAILQAHGFNKSESGIIAQHLVEAELVGSPLVGLIRLKLIVDLVKQGRSEIRTVREGPNFAHIDGGRNPGYLSLDVATRMAIAKAKVGSLAMVGLWNSSLTGMAGYYVKLAADAGLVGVLFMSSYARVAPFGGIDPLLGTNPIAFGFPAEPYPIIVDTATSSISNGDVELARLQGLELPAGSAIDGNGDPTRDPIVAQGGALLPFGRHKGYSIGLAMQLMGTLIGGEPVASTLGNYGFLISVFDPEMFGARDRFATKVLELKETLKGSRKAAGVEEILIPGEGRERRRLRTIADGIVVSREVAQVLKGLR
jgi:LDH2 family malate/lactate/ureidoglycolate dehydrogenase